MLFHWKWLIATADFMITEVHFDTLITNTNSMGKMVNISSVNEGDIKSTETADVMSYIMNQMSKNALYIKNGFCRQGAWNCEFENVVWRDYEGYKFHHFLQVLLVPV